MAEEKNTELYKVKEKGDGKDVAPYGGPFGLTRREAEDLVGHMTGVGSEFGPGDLVIVPKDD